MLDMSQCSHLKLTREYADVAASGNPSSEVDHTVIEDSA